MAQKIPSGFRIPTGIRLFATGDIHGRSDLLQEAMKKIDAQVNTHASRRNLRIFLGDYIDRGPNSREVIDHLIEIGQRHEAIFLSGNHETIAKEFLHNQAVLSAWQSLGGLETLVSYGVVPPLNPTSVQQQELADAFRQALPPSHIRFFDKLASSFVLGDIFFAHAGVRPGVPFAAQSKTDLMWIRDDFLQHQGLFEKLVVHGHTPVRTPDIHSNRINIDTGAYATGRLTCLWMEDDNFGFL